MGRLGGWKGGWGRQFYMVVYRPEDLLGRNEQTRHLPCRHFEIHRWELE